MKIVIVSTFWNSEKFVSDCINSLKNQYYTNFVAYFVDDMSTDKSYEIAKNTIGDDERFILIKNEEKKYKTKNFIDVIRYNSKIHWDDVIVEIDGDDQLADNFVLGRINKVFSDDNIWLCGTKFKDKVGRLGNYGRPNLQKPRNTSWNFSHMRSYRAFLFREIKDEHLKYNGEYFKAACDLGFGIPMMEMSGDEHFYYIDEPLYIYTWHDKQSYSDNNSFGDKTLQGKIASFIYGKLPKYGKLNIIDNDEPTILQIEIPKPKDLTPILKNKNTIDYDRINEILGKKNPEKPKPQPRIPNPPINRNEINQNKGRIQLAKESIKRR